MPPLRRWIIATVVLGALAWVVGTQLSDLRLYQLGLGMGIGDHHAVAGAAHRAGAARSTWPR